MPDIPLSNLQETTFFTQGNITCAIIAATCLIFIFFFSLIEKSFSSLSLSPSSIAELKNRKKTHRDLVISLLSQMPRVIQAMKAWRNLLLFVFGLSVLFLHASFLSLSSNAETSILLGTSSALLLWIFGHALPRKAAQRATLSFICRMASTTAWLLRASQPFLDKENSSESGSKNAEEGSLSVESLGDALKITEQQHDEEEKDMLKGILRFAEESVAEVMRPRIDIRDIDIHADFKKVSEQAIGSTFSRLPVMDHAEDKVHGILYIRDLLPHMNEGADFAWQQLIRPAYFVPESKMIDDLLREFQTNKIHIAIVVDEYGSASGLVTMEDILEEIVGEINDEYDKEEQNYVKLDESTYIFEGKTPLSDFFETLGLDEKDFEALSGEAETLAGLVLELLDEFPMPHQTAQCKQLHFEVLKVEERRITKVKVTRQSPVSATGTPAQ